MTGDNHILGLLQDYLDGSLTTEERLSIDEHLRSCSPCTLELQQLRKIQTDAGLLPKRIEPPHDLWPAIESRIRTPHRSMVVRWSLGIAAVVVLGVIGWSIFRQAALESRPSWQVIPVEGNPLIGATRIEKGAHIHIGELLETDGSSRAEIEVGSIGHVDVGPNTRIRLVEATDTDYRLSLEKGEIHATVSSPPRLFFVETPSALAVDLGCSYALRVSEDGTGILEVAAGYVAFELRGRRAIVPAGMSCFTRPGSGPGTPFLDDAPESFRKALELYDFSDTTLTALGNVLAGAREEDAITLWHLLFRVGREQRATVYDRLAELLLPPKDITRDGVLAGDRAMINDWQDIVGLGPVVEWEFAQ
jgi:predicted anti-sigma-YlaC factor YlaD